MSLSRRIFLADASVLGLLAALRPEIAAAQANSPQASLEDLPHDSFDFWNGFFDSVNPYSQNFGKKSASRGPTDQLPDPQARTQYLRYNSSKKAIHYATDVEKDELLDHDGDVVVSIALSQFRPGAGETKEHASQLRVDTTQIHPFMNILAPLAWTAIASVSPNNAGKISMDDLGFKSPQATKGTSKIMLTQGTGKVAVNVSKAPQSSFFVKALNVMISAAKYAAPMVSLPAISIPALSSFTEVLSYWEDRTRFIMSGNLTTAVATQQALDDPDREDHYIGLVSGDYLMVPQRHTEELAKALPNLDLVQGYLVPKDADPNLPLEKRAEGAVPGVTYATMRVTVQPMDSSASKSGGSDSDSDESSSSKSSSGKKSKSTSSSESKSKGSTSESKSTSTSESTGNSTSTSESKSKSVTTFEKPNN